MRILQIAPPWFSVPPEGYGGTEEIVSLLTEKLVTAGHEVTLLAAGGSRSGARLWTTFSEPPSGLLGDAAVELAHVMRGHRCRSQFDVIHDHTRGGAALGAVPGGPPVVHTLHGRWTTSDAMLYRELAESVALVAISHDQAARAPADVSVAAVVHNGIDVDRYPLATARGDHLAYLGRATADKGPDLAIEIARRLGRTLRMAIKVNEADERAYFGEVIAPMLADAGADVELVPVTTQAEKTAFLGAAAAVLFPIRWPEPFGLVPVEANACGTPVVAFANGAVPEVVEDGRSGFVVEPDDLDAFCRAVERVDELDPATCRASVTARFHADRMVQGYLNVYHRLVEGAHRPPAAPADLSCRPLHTLERRTESLRMERLATSKPVIAGPEHAISRPGS